MMALKSIIKEALERREDPNKPSDNDVCEYHIGCEGRSLVSIVAVKLGNSMLRSQLKLEELYCHNEPEECQKCPVYRLKEKIKKVKVVSERGEEQAMSNMVKNSLIFDDGYHSHDKREINKTYTHEDCFFPEEAEDDGVSEEMMHSVYGYYVGHYDIPIGEGDL